MCSGNFAVFEESPDKPRYLFHFCNSYQMTKDYVCIACNEKAPQSIIDIVNKTKENCSCESLTATNSGPQV